MFHSSTNTLLSLFLPIVVVMKLIPIKQFTIHLLEGKQPSRSTENALYKPSSVVPILQTADITHTNISVLNIDRYQSDTGIWEINILY